MCSLGGRPVVYFLGVPATFLAPSAGLVCNGPAPGQIASASPDRLTETLTQLGIDACQSGTGGGQGLTDNLGAGLSDDEALCDFASDSVDLAYSAVGYGASGSAFSPANCQGGAEPPRPYVAIPIALNAVVLAHSADVQQSPPYNGFGISLTGYSQLRITLAQFAQLLSNGGVEDVSTSGQVTSDSGSWNSQLGQGLLELNPQLSSGQKVTSLNNAIVGGGPRLGVAATSGTDATTYLATSFLDAVVPTQLVSAPDALAAFPSQPLGTISNFGAPPPAYNVQTYTGRSILTHYTTPLSGTAWWALTDAATAAATWGGLDDFALQTPDSLTAATPAQATYVAPTTSSMQAAVANMTAQPDGTLLPNPNGGAVDGVEPYPLTYVEYAIAPAQPLAQQRLHREHGRANSDESVADFPRQPGSGRLAGGDGTVAEHPLRPGNGRHRQGRHGGAGLHADRSGGGLELEHDLRSVPGLPRPRPRAPSMRLPMRSDHRISTRTSPPRPPARRLHRRATARPLLLHRRHRPGRRP